MDRVCSRWCKHKCRDRDHDVFSPWLLPRPCPHARHACPGRDRCGRRFCVVNDEISVIYILIDERGGHATDVPDSAPGDSLRSPLFGGYGPFVPTGLAVRKARLAGRNSTSSATRSMMLTGGQWSGTLRYHEQDISGSPLSPVPNTNITGLCYTPDGTTYLTATTTDAIGNFTFQCFDDAPGFQMSTNTFSNSYGTIREFNGQVVASSGYANPGDFVDARMTVDQAARVHLRYRELLPNATTRFGRTRGPVTTNVTASLNYQTRYDPTNDNIYLAAGSVFNQQGEFVILHEYGHSYYWVGIEPWGRN